jgi:hypothetical protein
VLHEQQLFQQDDPGGKRPDTDGIQTQQAPFQWYSKIKGISDQLAERKFLFFIYENYYLFIEEDDSSYKVFWF